MEYIDSKITGPSDWTYNQHRVIDTVPTPEDFAKTVWAYMEYEMSKKISWKDIVVPFEVAKNNPDAPDATN